MEWKVGMSCVYSPPETMKQPCIKYDRGKIGKIVKYSSNSSYIEIVIPHSSIAFASYGDYTHPLFLNINSIKPVPCNRQMVF